MFQLKFTPKHRLATLVLALAAFGASDFSWAAVTLAISGQPPTSLTATHSYTFQPTVVGAGTRTVGFRIANRPVWLQLNALTGRLYGTPSNANVGKYDGIVLSVVAGTTWKSLPAFAITVHRSDLAPTIGGTPQTSIAVNQSYVFQPTARDQEGAALSFSIQGKPTWLAFSSSTGRLYGTPRTANIGKSASIAMKVSDGQHSTALPAFMITVTNTVPTTALTIAGVPAIAVVVGHAYSFKPAATGAAGSPLTFSVQNKPSWMSFAGTTGLLSGTPTAAGRYANITMSVSDGKATASLAPFTVTVSPAVLSAVTLHWVAPTENVDGSPLVNLAGYRVQYGTDSAHMNEQLEIPGTDLTSVSIEGLAAGTYYFAVKAYNTDTLESELSEVIWKTLT